MEQRRRRPHPTRADQATKQTTRPSNGDPQIYCDLQWNSVAGAHTRPEPTKQPPDPLTEPDLLRFTMEQRRRRHTRPEPTKQPPDPLTEPDLLRFTMEQRRRRPHPTRADQATTRPSNGARSTAIYNGTASPAPTPDQSRPSNHQTL